MLNFFRRTLSFQRNYNIDKHKLSTIIKEYKSNELVLDFFYDDERHEGLIKGKQFFITFEVHSVPTGQTLSITVTDKLPFFVPKFRAEGFYQYIETKINNS